MLIITVRARYFVNHESLLLDHSLLDDFTTYFSRFTTHYSQPLCRSNSVQIPCDALGVFDLKLTLAFNGIPSPAGVFKIERRLAKGSGAEIDSLELDDMKLAVEPYIQREIGNIEVQINLSGKIEHAIWQFAAKLEYAAAAGAKIIVAVGATQDKEAVGEAKYFPVVCQIRNKVLNDIFSTVSGDHLVTGKIAATDQIFQVFHEHVSVADGCRTSLEILVTVRT